MITSRDTSNARPSAHPFRSRIIVGEVTHARYEPVVHRFRYPVYFYVFDLDELPALARAMPAWFGHNRWRPVSLRDGDYLREDTGRTIRAKLDAHLASRGIDTATIARVELVTAARFFGYVFNPVSFYFCHGTDGGIVAHVAEVNNTFGETHLYVLPSAASCVPDPGFTHRHTVSKAFHVSPFQDMAPLYDFHFGDISADSLDIRIQHLRDDGDGKTRLTFFSRMAGLAVPLDATNLRRTIVRFPLAAALTMPRILWQAARLHYGKKLKVYTKPHPSSADTIGVAGPGPLQRAAKTLMAEQLRKLRAGRLTLTTPDGVAERFGGVEPGPEAAIRVRDWRFFTRCAKAGDVGFGESFTAGEWESDDPARVVELFARNFAHFDDHRLWSAVAGRVANRMVHAFRPNTLRGARRNISAHYDLGNDFYRIWLDSESMMYSSALWTRGSQTLEDAQRAKLDRIIALADLRPGQHVLEIGTGWGGFALAAAALGCRVTTVTLSAAQRDLAEQRARDAGVDHLVDVRIQDFRRIEGRFDRIVSIEMLEAVGHDNLAPFFAACDRLLAPHGIVAIQVITIAAARYAAYRRGCDWIQKHIFPGCLVPSLPALSQACAARSGLRMAEPTGMGAHYALTLREWRSRFLANLPAVRALGKYDGAFERAWEYYLAYCEGGFRAGVLDVVQFACARPGERPALFAGRNAHDATDGCAIASESGPLAELVEASEAALAAIMRTVRSGGEAAR